MPAPGQRYTEARGHLHSPAGIAKAVLTALQVTTKYGHRQPTVAQLRADFGMSRATAYRWRAAWLYIQTAQLSKDAA